MSRDLPNILFLMVDQLAAAALPFYGHKVVKAPNLESFAASGAVFENAYCNFPLCAPSRFSMLSGRFATAIDAFDNASEFSAAIPTLSHHLGNLDYRTSLCGKMHFIGPDQLHGYQERLTTDVYPSDFAWTPNWLAGEKDKPSGVSMRSVVEAGSCLRSMQIDYDDEVEHFGLQKIYDLARAPEQRPFFLTISFTHPHPPFVISKDYWDRYRHEEVDMPLVPAIPPAQLDVYSHWLHIAHGGDKHTITDEHVRNARHAYYGMISYIDDKVGRILNALKETGLDANTLVVFASDHGEMLGERGMWYKQTFFERSVRVPLIVHFPNVIKSGRYHHVVSLVDLFPTLLDFATGGKRTPAAEPLDGTSLWPLLVNGHDNNWPDKAIAEYTAEGVRGPCRMLRRGTYKYVYTHGHPGQLFDLENDPQELENLAGRPDYARTEESLLGELLKDWDPALVMKRVLLSQDRRRFIYKVSRKLNSPNWAFEARLGDNKRFVRQAGDVVEAKARSRFPYVPPVPPDKTIPFE